MKFTGHLLLKPRLIISGGNAYASRMRAWRRQDHRMVLSVTSGGFQVELTLLACLKKHAANIPAVRDSIRMSLPAFAELLLPQLLLLLLLLLLLIIIIIIQVYLHADSTARGPIRETAQTTYELRKQQLKRK
jgi:hypothetical protein